MNDNDLYDYLASVLDKADLADILFNIIKIYQSNNNDKEYSGHYVKRL